MSLDSITEKIAHFIGAFELTSEQARLRDQYEEFTALRRKNDLEELEDPTRIQVKANLKLDPGDYDPLPYKFLPPLANIPPAPAFAGTTDVSSINPNPSLGPIAGVPDALGSGALNTQLVIEPIYISQPPGSAVTYTFQTIKLTDNDTIGQGDFRDVEALIEQGEETMDTAMSMHAMAKASIDIEDYLSDEVVEEIAEHMMSPNSVEVEGATVHQFHGEDACGAIVNGEHVEEMPVWQDLLPKNHQPEEESEEEDAPDLLPAEWDQSKDPEFEDGYSVSSGGNIAINEVAVSVGWVDAPNIVVGGQAVNLTVISQVAVVSDFDVGEPGAQSHTNVVQSSEVTVEASEASWLEDNVAEPGEDPFVAIDWIPGDLIVSNFINQVIDATDIDQISTEITASSSAYTMGENVLVNVANILQLGNFYDIIIVGGDMISIDIVSQTIVFLDDDVTSGVVPEEDNNNLVMNQVSLTTTGEDTHEEMSENLAELASYEEVDSDALEDALLNDPMFAGTELIRVLKIDGDLLQVNVIDQITLLNDQDDVDIDGPPGEDVAALSGGNAVLNSANINKMGVDSVVMAEEGEYSDLLIHQASLMDVPEDENAELVNEAVALLMEEVDGSSGAQSDADQIKLTPSEATSVDDGLQTVLA